MQEDLSEFLRWQSDSRAIHTRKVPRPTESARYIALLSGGACASNWTRRHEARAIEADVSAATSPESRVSRGTTRGRATTPFDMTTSSLSAGPRQLGVCESRVCGFGAADHVIRSTIDSGLSHVNTSRQPALPRGSMSRRNHRDPEGVGRRRSPAPTNADFHEGR